MESPTKNNLLRLLTGGPGEPVVWQAYDDSHAKRAELARAKYAAPKDAQGWIDGLQAEGAGVCIQINAGSRRGSKAIERVRLLFLDLDGAPLGAVKAATKQGLPKPHLVVQSSPGRWHVYWRPIHCPMDQFASVQKALAVRFGGDQAMINLDRVMRVPGSLNFKHNPEGDLVESKYFAPENPSVDVAELLLWLASAGSALSTGQLLNPPSVAPDSLLGAIDPEQEPLSEGDRTQKLVRLAGVWVNRYPELSADQIIGKLKVFEIQKLPKGQTPKSDASYASEIRPGVVRWCAQRDERIAIEEAERVQEQVRLAREYQDLSAPYNEMIDTSPMTIADFTQRFVYVSSEAVVYDLHKAPSAEPWKLSDFKLWSGVHKDGETVLCNLWLRTARYRKTVHKTTYVPYAPTHSEEVRRMNRIVRDPATGELAYNIYNPPTTRPAEALDKSVLRPFLDHVQYLCKRDLKLADLMLDWLAATIQKPFRRIMWAPLIISTHQGIGKGLFAKCLQELVGVSNYRQIYQSELENTNQFNGFLSDSKVVVLDEIKARRRVDMYARLQGMITETVMEINRKFGAKRQERVHANFIGFSNHVDCLALPPEDRRFLVIINDAPPKSYDYYSALANWIDNNANISHLMAWLLQRDISNFGWGERPRCQEDKDRLIEAGQTDLELAFFGALKAAEGPFTYAITTTQCVYQYLASKCDLMLDKKDMYIISGLLRRVGRPVGRVQIGQMRTGAWCVRDFEEKWRGQDISDVREEVKRSMRAAGDTSEATTPDKDKRPRVVPRVER